MIYFFIIISTLVYFFFLTINKKTESKPQGGKIMITMSLILSLNMIYVFSNSYDYSNSKAYKIIYSKNLSVRNNIKTIKDNVPMLESKLLNNPDDFNGWLMLGKSYSILKNYQKASRAYQVAINLRPNNMAAIKEYILVLRSDSETINKELIKK